MRLKNIVFRKNGKHFQHDDALLHKADLVIITFEFQKNDKRDVSVHMFATEDKVLCPVVAWATTVRRVWSYPGSTEDTKVCQFRCPTTGTVSSIQANHVRDYLRVIVDLIGVDVLSFTSEDVGLHSIRSGGAMAMFLSKTSTIIIMRIGQWSSEAFLEYIREQVENFLTGVSQNMLAFECG